MDSKAILAAMAVVLLAGCANEPQAAAPLTTDTDVLYGALAGRVLDDEFLPVPNVTVALPEASEQTQSDAEGDFAFPALPVGRYTLAASHGLYNETVRSIDIVADQTLVLDLTLVKKPEFRATNHTEILHGSFDCGLEVPILTGPCWIVVEGTTCGDPLHYCVYDPVFKSDYKFKLDVKPRWQTIIAELTWTSGTTALDGMRLYVENANQTAIGTHAPAVAKVHGNKQPLTARIERGTPGPGHETYEGTKTPVFIPDEGGLQQLRVFPKGQAYQYTGQICNDGQCFLGAGVGLNVRFTVHVTIFYNESAPLDFSAIPKA